MSTTPSEIPDEKVIRLPKPVVFADQSYGELRLREPTRREVKRLRGKSGADAAMELLFDISGVPLGAIDKIGTRSLRAAREWMEAMCAGPPLVDDPPETLVIRLRKSVTYDEDTIHELALREPTAGELRRAESGGDLAEKLISAITGHPVFAIERIGIRDFNKAEAYLAGFI